MRPRRRAAAFTFPEAIVTMALLLSFSVVAGGLFYQGQLAFSRQDERTRQLQDEISLVSTLSQVCQSIRVPEWGNSETAFRTEGTQIVASYFMGSSDSEVRVNSSNSAVSLTTPFGQWSWYRLPELTVTWWKVSDRIVGLVASWNGLTGPQSVHLLWGSHPL